MNPSKRLYHYTYTIYDTKRGYIYGGKRSTVNEPELDNYYGSGSWPLRIQRKYGLDSFVNEGRFVKSITKIYDSVDDCYEGEIDLIRSLRESYGKLCMNIADGGQGGPIGDKVWNYDHTVHHFYDMDNDEHIHMTQNDLVKTYGLNQPKVSSLVNGSAKWHKNFCLFKNWNGAHPNRGGNNKRADVTPVAYYDILTATIIIETRIGMADLIQSNLGYNYESAKSSSHMIANEDRVRIGRYCLAKNKKDAIDNLPRLYVFKNHITGELVTDTVLGLVNKYNLQYSSIYKHIQGIVKKPRSGWCVDWGSTDYVNMSENIEILRKRYYAHEK